MAANIANSIRSRREQLRRLALVFKVEIRLKIVAELYIRAMSPKEFHEEFGGGSLPRVAQHFAVLAEHGWLRRVGCKGRETKRRGPSETLYRATELAFFDAEMWALLPYSLRLACSWSLFKATANELREGIRGSLEGRRSRDLTCERLELDQLGWTHVIAQLSDHFESIFEEQVDAKIRVANDGGELIRAGVLQIGFESPRDGEHAALRLADGPASEPPMPFSERLAPIFADDLSMQIIAELNTRDMSVRGFHREHDSDVSEWAVRYRFDRLKKMGWLAIVDKIKKRATYEYIYRATRPAMADGGPSPEVPEGLSQTKTWSTFEHLSELVREAVRAGTFDARDDRHLSWSIVSLDLEGWRKVRASMEALSASIGVEEERARKRIDRGGKPLAMVVALSLVESPVGAVKAP